MKKYVLFAASLAVASVMGWNSAQAQTLFTPSGTVSTGAGGSAGVGIDANPAFAPLDIVGNNILLRPTNTFSPNGKFIGIGESGGVVGPINGCDIYGFRAQRSLSAFVNIGVGRFPQISPIFPPPPPNDVPIISWGSEVPPTSPFVRRRARNLEFRWDNSNTSCGNLVARMSGVGLYRFTVFGSALASGGNWVNSDARFKQNIQPIGNAMDLISQLEGTTYSMKVAEFPERNFNEGTQYGFIAQNLQEVMPEVVMADEEGYLAVNYDAVVPLLVEGMKEQQDQLVAQKVTIEEQNADLENAQQVNAEQQVRLETAEIKNEELTNQVDELVSVVEQQDAAIRQLQEEMMAMKNSLQASGATKTTSASDEQVQLFQNRPNPFRESTEIHFYLPSTVEQATLVVFNLEGKEIARFGNLDRGYGNVVLEAGALQPGNYVYRLIADNEVVDSKTLVLSK